MAQHAAFVAGDILGGYPVELGLVFGGKSWPLRRAGATGAAGLAVEVFTRNWYDHLNFKADRLLVGEAFKTTLILDFRFRFGAVGMELKGRF